jgi:hypothetical protein
MKNALLVTSENTKLAYTHLEITNALVKNGYNVQAFNVTSANTSDRELVNLNKPEIAILSNPFVPRRSDVYTENIDFLKTIDTVYVNDLTSHIEACNKWVSVNRILNSDTPFVKTVLTDFNDVPRSGAFGEIFYGDVDLDVLDVSIEQLGGFPLVYKGIYGAMGSRVHLARNKEHLKEILINNEAYPSFILQEYIKNAEAVMLCVRVVGEEVFPRIFLGSPLEYVVFKSVIAEGRLHLPCTLTEEIRNASLTATRTLGLDTARIDMFIDKDGVRICEVNSMGSMMSTDQVHNISTGELIVNHAINKLKNKQLESNNVTNDQ